jgi:hypothetical protein
VFILSLLLGITALIIQLILSEFSLPQFYAFGFIFIGFAWSAYQAHRELSLKVQQALHSTHAVQDINQKCSVSFVNGKEYGFSISDPYDGQNTYITKTQRSKKVKSRFDERGVFFVNDKVYYLMGKGSLEINIQLYNAGVMPLDVLSVEMDNNLDLNHVHFHNKGLFHHGKKLRLPFHLESGEVVIIQAKYKIAINTGSNEALFAADFRALPRIIAHEVLVNTTDAENASQIFTSQLNIPSKHLVDLYVNQWREYDQEEYLVLAGF